MASKEPIPGGHPVPMTVERALTAVTQCRRAVERAHREMTEALVVMAALADRVPPGGPDASRQASRLLHLSSLLKQLDGMRAELLNGIGVGQSPNGSGPHPTIRLGPASLSQRPAGALERPDFEGEFPTIGERLVVSPGWGRIHRRRLQEGRRLDGGAIIADLRSDGRRMFIRAPMSAIFVSWLIHEGAVVTPGTALARLQPDDS